MHSNETLVHVRDLTKHFVLPGGWLSGNRDVVRAVDSISFDIYRGEVLGIVGESGCGKTTLGRLLLRLIEPTTGEVLFDGVDLTRLRGKALRQMRKRIQIVFQNPLDSLSPRMSVAQAIAEPFNTHGILPGKKAVYHRTVELLEMVGLGEQHMPRFPHELSGGQCQRVAVARALALEPDLLVLDEPTSALDVSVQAQLINLLDDLRCEKNLTYMFISHDLSVVQHISDRIGVMYLGRLAEIGPTEQIFTDPRHPYTRALLSAIPIADVGPRDERIMLHGTVPSPTNPPSGCRFHTRCPIAEVECSQVEPTLDHLVDDHWAACHFAWH